MKKQYKIAVIGGQTASEKAKDAAKNVGYEIIRAGHLLYSGGYGDVGNAAVDGAVMACEEIKKKPEENIFICLPKSEKPKNNKATLKVMGNSLEERREAMIKEIDGAVAISGGVGTTDEINLCQELSKPVIPIGGEGAAEKLRKLMKGDLYLKQLEAPFLAVATVASTIDDLSGKKKK